MARPVQPVHAVHHPAPPVAVTPAPPPITIVATYPVEPGSLERGACEPRVCRRRRHGGGGAASRQRRCAARPARRDAGRCPGRGGDGAWSVREAAAPSADLGRPSTPGTNAPDAESRRPAERSLTRPCRRPAAPRHRLTGCAVPEPRSVHDETNDVGMDDVCRAGCSHRRARPEPKQSPRQWSRQCARTTGPARDGRSRSPRTC